MFFFLGPARADGSTERPNAVVFRNSHDVELGWRSYVDIPGSTTETRLDSLVWARECKLGSQASGEALSKADPKDKGVSMCQGKERAKCRRALLNGHLSMWGDGEVRKPTELAPPMEIERKILAGNEEVMSRGVGPGYME